MHEILDFVDGSDQVIGQATRAEVHRLKLKHRATHIVLSNCAAEVFVQLRSMQKDNNPGLWDTSAAGHVDAGETYLQCACRELKEELGIGVNEEELVPLCLLPPLAETGFEFAQIYTLTSDLALTLEVEEIDDGCWCSPDDLTAWMAQSPDDFTTAFRTIWQTVCSG